MARISLTRSIKFRRLVKALDMPEPHVRGHLDYLWESCWESVSPVLGTPEVVELVAMWNGPVGQFAQALETIGFLDRDDQNRLVVHDFWEHAPDYVDRRLARHAKKQKELYNRETTTPSRPHGRRQASESTASRPAPSPEVVSLSSNGIVPNSSARDYSADHSTEITSPEPRNHTNPPAAIDELVDYATEVLNKLEGVTTPTERTDRGALLKIAKHTPPSVVKRALADTQDAHQRGTLQHAGKYFSARVTAMCQATGIKSPFAIPNPRKAANSHA